MEQTNKSTSNFIAIIRHGERADHAIRNGKNVDKQALNYDNVIDPPLTPDGWK